MTETIIAFAQTKKRTVIGMVGIEVDDTKKIAYVRLAKQWERQDMHQIPPTVKSLHQKIQWDTTYADQLVGQHLLKEIEYESGINIFAINTQKNIKEPEEEDGIKRMDQTEMTQFFLSLKLIHKIQFPKKNTSLDMENLIKQTEMFKEVTTEQGTVSYYAPGNELDCLIKSLMICCFAGRTSLEKASMPFMVVVGDGNSNTSSSSLLSAQGNQKIDTQNTLNKLLGKKTKPNSYYYSYNTSGILNL